MSPKMTEHAIDQSISKTTEIKLVCAYIRVSTADQEEYSPDAQIRLLKEYATSHNMILVDIYQDLGISGRKADKRPEFQDMIAAAKSKEHPYDAILVWKFSRFARNQEESIVYKSLLKKNDVEVISVSEPLPDGFIGELVERIFEWMDEYYSIRLSGEVKRGMTQKALSGGYNSRPPIGYTKDKGSDTVPYPDSYYADMVKQVFHKFAVEKISLTQIASNLNAMGYRTRSGCKWETRNMVDLIQNPFYIGKIRWNYSGNRSKKITGDTIIVDGRHEPIIDNDLWDMAQKHYAEITASHSHAKRITVQKHWLSGILRCPACGGSLAYQRGYDKSRDRDYPYFLCWHAVKGMCNTRNSISVAKAEHAVMAGIKHMIDNCDLAELNPVHLYEPDTKALEQQLSALNVKLKRIREAYINGIDSIDEYRQNKNRIESEIETVKNKYNALPAVPEPLTADKLKSVYEFIETSNVVADRSAALHSIIEYIIYDKSKDTIEFILKNSDKSFTI